jgi:hypothetical protein
LNNPPEREISEPAVHPHEKMAHASRPHDRSRRAMRETEQRRHYARADEARRRADYDSEMRRSSESPRRGLLFTDVWPEGSWHQNDRR